MPLPTNNTQIFEGQLEGEGEGNAREDWQQMRHRAAPGVDWKAMDQKNKHKIYKERKAKGSLETRSVTTYANGNLAGSWLERGSNNQSGSLEEVEYFAPDDKIYGISGGGTLWKGNLDGSDWTALNDGLQFEGNALKVIPMANSTGFRIIAALGKQVMYSDDDGATWTSSAGLNFYDTWGNPLKMVALNNAENSLYYLVRTWQASPWGAAVDLYYSNDQGETFSKIANYLQWNYERISMWSPFDTDELYLLENGTNLHTISDSTLSILNTNSNLSTTQWTMLTGAKSGASTIFYALMNKNRVYKSTNNGASWSLIQVTPVSTWDVGLLVSPFNANNLCLGAIECYTSVNGGTSWSKVNNWWDYYSDPDKLHADIMDIKSFKKTNNTEFVLIANHGGIHISYDNLATTTNISTSGLNVGQYYDVRTDPTDSQYLYAGAQDQGHQRSSAAETDTLMDFSQVISGDYGHMAFSGNGTSMWTVYPGGWVTFYPSPKTGSYQADYDIIGTHPSVSDWISPTAEFPNTANHKILIAGGNITGEEGSYLVQLTASLGASWTITATQFATDFRAESTSGTATISSIAVSPLNASKYFVGMSDGSFFYSNDAGANWELSATTGPGQFWLYGASILPSKVEEDLVWFAGSGYSNSPVYKSIDGGATFTQMNNGLPNTLVQEITANETESMLFAATEIGVYTYVAADDEWYSMMEGLPQQNYYSIECTSTQTIRLGSYGRGIWDFNPAPLPVLPLEWISFEVQKTDERFVNLTWKTTNEFNNDYFEIQKSKDGLNFENIGEVTARGEGSEGNTYSFTDKFPFIGENLYRLKQVDTDDKYEYSIIKSVDFEPDQITANLYPNPVFAESNLNIQISKKGNYTIFIYDESGQIVLDKSVFDQEQITLPNLVAGYYFYEITTGNDSNIAEGKLLVN